jgi:hypothetical protein
MVCRERFAAVDAAVLQRSWRLIVETFKSHDLATHEKR